MENFANTFDSGSTSTQFNTNSNVSPYGQGNEDELVSKFTEKFTLFEESGNHKNIVKEHEIVTEKNVPRLGVMLVGLGGNNGSTLVAGLIANQKKTTWETKNGTMTANFYGSFT